MTLAELRHAVELLPADAAVTLSRSSLLEALEGSQPATVAPKAEEPELWMTVDQAASLLNVSPRWCYDHAEQLGAKRLSRRCVRFSSRAVQRYLARKG